jgi:hypothetical protein
MSVIMYVRQLAGESTRFWCQLVSSVVDAILLFSFADTLSSLLLGSEEQDRARP